MDTDVLVVGARPTGLMLANQLVRRGIRFRIMARILGLAMGLDPCREFAFRTISQTGIAYPGSPRSESSGGLPGTAPRPEDRFPWVRLRFRPDGHVGLAGARLRPEAAARYVRERLHLALRGEALAAVHPLRGEA